MKGIYERRTERRRAGRSRNPADLKNLNQRHHEILELALLGFPDAQIAEAVGCKPMTVFNARNSTLGKEKLGMMRAARDTGSIDVAKKMQEMIPKALEIYDKILSEGEEGDLTHGGASIQLQKQTADMVLKEFSGLAVPRKVMVGHAHFTAEMLEEIKEQGKKAALECGTLEIPFTEGL